MFGLRFPVLFQLLVIVSSFGVLASHTTSYQGQSPAPQEAIVPGAEGWVSLFEGASLRGWAADESGDWIVLDSVLTGRNGSLLNRWCWVDFELKLQFRGGGLLRFRVGSDQTGHIGFGQPGYYLDLATGSLHSAEGMVLSKAEGSWPSDGWHSLTLTASQGILSFSADNGARAEITNADSPLKGRIGFSATAGGVQVRQVRIRRLNQKSLRNIPADNYYCYVCHANFEYEDSLVEVHLESDIGCAACHGPSLPHRSDEDNVTPPDIIYRRPQVDPTCLKCHDRHEEKEAPADRTLPADPICTDCHGDHRLFD